LIFPVMMVARMFGEKQQNRLEQKVETAASILILITKNCRIKTIGKSEKL
jgi:hypothetical protein